MTVAQSIVHASTMIKMVCEWIDREIRDGGFSTPDSLGQTYLTVAESILRDCADEIAERRKALLANQPGPFDLSDDLSDEAILAKSEARWAKTDL